jgi:hypothetical protein
MADEPLPTPSNVVRPPLTKSSPSNNGERTLAELVDDVLEWSVQNGSLTRERVMAIKAEAAKPPEQREVEDKTRRQAAIEAGYVDKFDQIVREPRLPKKDAKRGKSKAKISTKDEVTFGSDSKPEIKLPADNQYISEFATELGEILRPH